MIERASLRAEILGYADGNWPKFASAESITKITGIDAAKILQYASEGICPHVRIDGKQIAFIKQHILRWLRENVIQICEGKSLAPVPVLVQDAAASHVPKQLQLAAKRLVMVSEVVGIYFLCREDVVVYVGQSLDVASRIKQHLGKVFDRAFCLPCPASQLNRVEAAFISLLKPEYNLGKKRGKEELLIHSNTDAFANPQKVITELFGEEAA